MLREQIRARRRERSQPVSEWLEAERHRILLHGDPGATAEGLFIEPVQRMYAESMRLSQTWADEYRRFWDLPADFDFDIATPTVDISKRLLEGRDPDEMQRQPRTDVRRDLPKLLYNPAAAASEETLTALIDGELPGRQVRELQAGYKDAERFDTYVSILQRRWPFEEDRILLPFGLHMAIVERPDGEIVIRSDSGHIFGDYRQNWKLNAAIAVRRDRESMLEIFPEKMHPDPRWNEIREYYDPVNYNLLDVESTPPGYPPVHDFLPDLEVFYRDWLGRPLREERDGWD